MWFMVYGAHPLQLMFTSVSLCCHLCTYRLYMQAHSLRNCFFKRSRCMFCMSLTVHLSESVFSQSPYRMRLFSCSATSCSTMPLEAVKLCIIHTIPSRPGPAETACLRNSLLLLVPCSSGNRSLLAIVLWRDVPLIHFESVCFNVCCCMFSEHN